MVYLPVGVRSEILRRVGKNGFRELAPFIAGERDWHDATFTKEVLEEVDLDEFIFVSSLANEGSVYRPFFLRCLREGNVTAKYVEGLRLAVKEGPSRESLQYMESAIYDIPYASFAYGIFLICNGHYEEGAERVKVMCLQVSWLEDMVEIADLVMASIADVEPQPSGKYNATYRYPDGDIPMCAEYGCSIDDVCFGCIAYWYAGRVRDLC